jgi:hypothetical protein
VACAVLISWPFAEVGRNDDWSYAQSTLELLHTGKLVYNGWSTAMLGAQAFWGAAIIKVFGFSFTALRLGVLPFTCWMVAILYLLARRVGAAAPIATMAALTVGLSQLAIECAATYSTDLPALFCFTFALHQIVRSLDENRTKPAQIVLPLLLAAMIGYAGGSIRQVYWLMPLAGLAYAAWVRRREPINVAITLLFLAAVTIAMLATEAWSHAQPFFIPEYFHAMVVVFFGQFPRTLLPTITLAMTITLFALPMIVGSWRAQQTAGASLAQGIALVIGVAAIWWAGDDALAPWLGNLVTQFGIMYRGQDAIGNQPQVIPDAVRLVLTLMCCAAGARLLLSLVRLFPRWAPAAVASQLPHVLCISGLFAVPYTALILFRGPAFSMSDRYTLPLTATLCLWLAWLCAKRGIARMTNAGWSLLVIVALFGIAVTHDEFAATRARLRAADALTDRGIPRTAITAGVDYDAWTQLQQVGYVNDARIVNPPNVFVPHPRLVPVGRTDYWFWEWAPLVRPDYFVVDTQQQDLENIPSLTFPYRAWLPPFDRAAYVQKRPTGWVIPW